MTWGRSFPLPRLIVERIIFITIYFLFSFFSEEGDTSTCPFGSHSYPCTGFQKILEEMCIVPSLPLGATLANLLAASIVTAQMPTCFKHVRLPVSRSNSVNISSRICFLYVSHRDKRKMATKTIPYFLQLLVSSYLMYTVSYRSFDL